MPDISEEKVAEKSPASAASQGAKASSAADAKAAAKEVNTSRRRLVWACIWGYLGVNFLMFLRFFFPRALFEPPSIFSIGYPAELPMGVETKFQRQYRIWPVREPDKLFVIYAKCTHLGCTPDWKANENKFKCPCHGSGYDSEGVNFEGPAPRPMDRALLKLDPTGQIVVDTSRLFVNDPRAGVNHFNDPGAFLNV